MENNIAITAIQKRMMILEKQMELCKDLLEELTTNKGVQSEANVPEAKSNEVSSKTDSKLIPTEYQDYPFSKSLVLKLEYLDEKESRGWKMTPRMNLIGQLEPPEKQYQYMKNISQTLKALVFKGTYISVKYGNDNKAQYYFRREWLNLNGQNTTIKEGFEPNDEEWINMPDVKKSQVKWSIAGESE